MAAAEHYARKAGWTLDKNASGKKQGLSVPGQEGKTRPPVFFVRWWNFDAGTSDKGDFNVWITGPAYPNQRMNTCQVAIPGAFRDQMIALLSSRLKLGDMTPTMYGFPGWVLSGDRQKPDAGVRLLAVTEQEMQLPDAAGDVSRTLGLPTASETASSNPRPGALPVRRKGSTVVFTMVAVVDVKTFHGALPPGSLP